MNSGRQLKLSQILDYRRAPDTLIAWRGQRALYLAEFRSLILQLIKRIEPLAASRWALCFNDSYYFAAALLALLYCGKTAVIPGHLRQAGLAEQRDEFDALLTDLPLQLDCPTVDLPSLTIAPGENAPLPNWPQQQDLILFTSGSTGKPKAIAKPIELLELENQILVSHYFEQLKTTNRIVATVSHQHLYGLTFRILLPLMAGLPFDAGMIEYHEQLQNYPPNAITLIASPAFLTRLDPQLAPIGCRLAFSAGGPLDYRQAQRVNACLSVLPQEIYGTSETGIIASRTQRQPDQIWTAFSGITVSQNADKTININSPLFRSAEGGAINDIIELEGEGFHLVGRKDRMIKIAEKRLSLAEIEQRLMRLPEIEDAAVVALTQNNRTVIGAVIVLSLGGRQQYQRLGQAALTRQLRQQLRSWLEPVALPKRWRIVNAIAQNSQGKRAYLELQELFL